LRTVVLPAPAHQQVDLHVHQAGQQNGVPEIDDLALGFTSDADDSVAVDPHDPRPDDLAGFYINKTRCFEGQHA
jgi:hypothetical protein